MMFPIVFEQVGSEEAIYNLNAIQKGTNALDPYHVCYLFTDNGISGKYKTESTLRRRFEKYIKSKTTLDVFGTKGMNLE